MNIDRTRKRRLILGFTIIILVSGGLSLSKPGTKLLNYLMGIGGAPASAENSASNINKHREQILLCEHAHQAFRIPNKVSRYVSHPDCPEFPLP